MNVFLLILCVYFFVSLLCAVVRFVIDVFRYPIFCKVLKKNIKMFKLYQKRYKSLIKDLEKEREEVKKMKEGVTVGNSE